MTNCVLPIYHPPGSGFDSMGLCHSAMDSPRNLARKPRKARPPPLKLRNRSDQRFRPPTPYPWRVKPEHTTQTRIATRPCVQLPEKLRVVYLQKGRARLVNVPKRAQGKMPNKPSSKTCCVGQKETSIKAVKIAKVDEGTFTWKGTTRV